jgi:hypothetical protein
VFTRCEARLEISRNGAYEKRDRKALASCRIAPPKPGLRETQVGHKMGLPTLR